jgi:hypothetical protein
MSGLLCKSSRPDDMARASSGGITMRMFVNKLLLWLIAIPALTWLLVVSDSERATRNTADRWQACGAISCD